MEHVSGFCKDLMVFISLQASEFSMLLILLFPPMDISVTRMVRKKCLKKKDAFESHSPKFPWIDFDVSGIWIRGTKPEEDGRFLTFPAGQRLQGGCPVKVFFVGIWKTKVKILEIDLHYLYIIQF